MNEPDKKAKPAGRHEAIDISDFVYAATGARVRRLTMPDGRHWFPAVDVCKELGECLRLLRKHTCIHSRGGTEDGAPVYVLNQP
ncbi:hypothetical protein SAMN05216533_4227 [Streptomyces sp. Ag109_O5-10]|nr:hypothetical protein SAMN05216533_4227 [Streptomyces sp. Ag109_O5-10]